MTVRLRYSATGTELSIEDDGTGCPDLVEGVGIRGMRERIHSVGGTLQAEALPSRGFRLLAQIGTGQEGFDGPQA